MSFANLVKNDFLKYTETVRVILNEYKNYKIVPYVTEYDEKIMDIFDDDKKILSSHFELVGTYDINTSLFFWSSGFELLPKSKIFTKLKEFKKQLEEYIVEKSYNDLKYIEQLYYYIDKSIILLSKENLDILSQIMIYVTKYIGVVWETVNDKQLLYVLTDIISMK